MATILVTYDEHGHSVLLIRDERSMFAGSLSPYAVQ